MPEANIFNNNPICISYSQDYIKERERQVERERERET